MAHLPETKHGRLVAAHRPTSLDLIMAARAMRHQWFVAAFARLSLKLARLVSAPVRTAYRPRPNVAGIGAPAVLRPAGVIPVE